MADQQPKSIVLTKEQVFGWGVFSLFGIIALVGVSSNPLVSLGIYCLLQFCMVCRWAHKSTGGFADESDLVAAILMTVIATFIVGCISFIGVFWAVLVAFAFLLFPSFMK
jgi:hypothetical protein